MNLDGYKSLKVWQQSIELAKLCYKITSKLPRSEIYRLISQINRAAVSISLNIAEGYGRNSNKEFIQFLYISLGSCNELETLFLLSKEFGFISVDDYERIDSLRSSITKMLIGLIDSRKKRP